MSDAIKQNYELAFHITQNIDEAGVQKTYQELEKFVTSHGGIVLFSKEPEKIRLAYPIKHQAGSYFGFFNFNLESSESVNQIRDELRLSPNIIRFLVLKLKEESKKKKEDIVRRMAVAEKRRARIMKPAEKPGASKDLPKVDEKEIDEKLEEIIEKL